MTKQKNVNKMEKTNANVQTTSVQQTANELLGTAAKELYFLVIETPVGKLTINVGKKTHDQVKNLTVPRETSTTLTIDNPIPGLQKAAAEAEERAKKLV